MLRVLIPISSGFTDSEFIYAYYRMLEEGHEVFIATPDGAGVVGDKGWIVKDNQVNYSLNNGFPSNQISFDVLCLIGGVKCIEKLRLNEHLIDLISFYFYESKDHVVIASICHGAQLLIEADVIKHLKGRVAGYYSIARDIENAGGLYSESPSVAMYNNGRNIAVVTAAHYDDNAKWMKLTIEAIQNVIGK